LDEQQIDLEGPSEFSEDFVQEAGQYTVRADGREVGRVGCKSSMARWLDEHLNKYLREMARKREALKEAGRKGGKVRSQRKTQANTFNSLSRKYGKTSKITQ
jgi:general stress protein YciG